MPLLGARRTYRRFNDGGIRGPKKYSTSEPSEPKTGHSPRFGSARQGNEGPRQAGPSLRCDGRRDERPRDDTLQSFQSPIPRTAWQPPPVSRPQCPSQFSSGRTPVMRYGRQGVSCRIPTTVPPVSISLSLELGRSAGVTSPACCAVSGCPRCPGGCRRRRPVSRGSPDGGPRGGGPASRLSLLEPRRVRSRY